MESKIEINAEFKKAFDLIENTCCNVFITGKAGTGKSTFLEYFRQITRKNIIVLAPTGVAALNVNGETIHSFMRFKPDITVEKVKREKHGTAVYKKAEVIVIDEISMVRADLLDCADKFMRINGKDKMKPFGGAQMVFIGDLYQLPPVVTSRERKLFDGHYESPYFFSSHVFKDFQLEFIELEKIYRQKEEKFIRLLNEIRNNSVTNDSLILLNKQLNATLKNHEGLYPVYLTPFNERAAEINREHLNMLNAKIHYYHSVIEGNFNDKSYPADDVLMVSEGAQVIFLNNDSSGRWVNGTIGKVKGFVKDGTNEIIIVETEYDTIEVAPYEWDLFHYNYNAEKSTMESETAGTFIQYPLKLAWAVTIHKSQGKTFNEVIIDMGRGAFAFGQTYVALSRCVSFEGISLLKPISKKDIRVDKRVIQFLTKYQYGISEREMPSDDKIKIIKEIIKKNGCLEIIYLKAKDEKSKRIIRPLCVGEEQYKGKIFTGLKAFCMNRNEERMFRVDRILKMAEVKS